MKQNILNYLGYFIPSSGWDGTVTDEEGAVAPCPVFGERGDWMGEREGPTKKK